MPQILETPYGEIEFGDDVSSEDMQSIYEKNLPELKKQQVQEIPPPDLSKTFLKPPGLNTEWEDTGFEDRKKRAMEFMSGTQIPEAPRGFGGAFQEGFQAPSKGQAAAAIALTKSDDELKNILLSEFREQEKQSKRYEEQPQTLSEKAGQFIGGLAGSLPQYIAPSVVAGPVGPFVSFGASAGGEEFLKAGTRALGEGKSPEEALAISKAAAPVGAAIGGTQALILPGGTSTWGQAARESGKQAGAAGAGTTLMNLYERALGLKPPVTEGVLENMATMGALPLAGHALGRILPRIQTPNERITPDARSIEKAAEVHGDVRPLSGEGVREMPIEESGARVHPQAKGGIPEKGPARDEVLLDQQIKDLEQDPSATGSMPDVVPVDAEKQAQLQQLKLEKSKIDQSKSINIEDVQTKSAVEEVANQLREKGQSDGFKFDHITKESPYFAEHGTDVMWTDVKDGSVHVNTAMIPEWIRENKLTNAKFRTWFESGLTHETIHSNLLKALGEKASETMSKYWGDATKLEQVLTSRAYNRKGGKVTDTSLLGHEMFRRHAERFAGLSPTEVVQSKGMEWVTQKFIDLLERGIFEARRKFGTKASQRQLDILNKYQKNIDLVRKARGWKSPEEGSLRMEPAKEEKKALEPNPPVGTTVKENLAQHRVEPPEQWREVLDKYGVSYGGKWEGMDLYNADLKDSGAGISWRGNTTPEQLAEKINAKRREFVEAEKKKSSIEKPAETALRMEPKKEEPKSSSVSFAGTPDITVARANKDYGIINNINTPQWNFMFGKMGQAAKSAIERIFTGEFRMRESIARDVRTNVEDLMSSLPRSMRSGGGKAFFDVLNGKTPEQIQKEWAGRRGGDKVIAAANQVKGRLEEIRTTIRDGKREAYQGYLQGMDSATLSDLYERNIGQHPGMTKAEMAESLARLDYPDDWGIADGSYLPHLFFGQYKITATIPGQEGSAFISRAKTPSEAKAKIYQLSKSNPDYANAHFTVEQDTVIPADMIRLGDKKFWSMVQRMKQASGMTAQEIKDAQKGIIGRKAAKQKWFGSLQERKGFEGYSDDFKRVMTAYLSGFHRWRELSSMQREVQPMIDQVRSEGRPLAASELESIVEYLWGKPSKETVQLDAMMRRIPLLRDYVKPLALDRWSRNIRSLASMLTLRTIRFATLNRLQPLQGLYPMVGERLLAKGKLLQHTKEGRQLLDQSGVTFDVSQFGTEGSIPSKLRRFGEKFSGERSNQELAFLTMFLHGREKGLPQAEAIKYAKLRGQLMTQFVPLMSDIPAAFRGPVGQMVFQFKRFPIKQAELMGQMIREKNIGGIARMLAVFGMIGGASFYMRQTLQNKEKQLRLRKYLKDELGERGANLAMYGLPGLLGADFSGSLVLGDEPMGQNIYEKIGRQVTGPAPSLIYETGKGVVTSARQPTTAGEKAEAVIRRIPTLRPIAEAIDLLSGDLSVKIPAGETKYERSVSDAIAGLGSFRTANDANRQLAVSGIMEISREVNQLKNDAYVALQSGGEADKQFDAIRKFNERWPEASITAEDIRKYIDYRQSESVKTLEEKAVKGKYAPLLQELR